MGHEPVVSLGDGLTYPVPSEIEVTDADFEGHGVRLGVDPAVPDGRSFLRIEAGTEELDVNVIVEGAPGGGAAISTQYPGRPEHPFRRGLGPKAVADLVVFGSHHSGMEERPPQLNTDVRRMRFKRQNDLQVVVVQILNLKNDVP